MVKVDGTAEANFAAIVANAVTEWGAGLNDETYVVWNAFGSGDTYVLIDEDNDGAWGAGDTLIILTGINLSAEIVAADFV